MTMKLIVLTLLGYFSHISAEMQEQSSSASLEISDRSAGQKILKEEHSRRLHLDTDGTTLMAGSSPGKVSASLIRREGLTARPHKPVKMADEEEFEEEEDFSPLQGDQGKTTGSSIDDGLVGATPSPSVVDDDLIGDTTAAPESDEGSETEAPESSDNSQTDDPTDLQTDNSQTDDSQTDNSPEPSDDSTGLLEKPAPLESEDSTDSQTSGSDSGSDSDSDSGSDYGSGLSEEPSASLIEHARKAGTKVKAVTWEPCPKTGCSCAKNRRRVVIRFRREGSSGYPAIEASVHENWYFRVRQHGKDSEGKDLTYNGTKADEFNKGFIGTHANNLQACGGNANFSKDCLYEPQTCTFQTPNDHDKNHYDAKAGEYCCSADRKYCSYKCKHKETFHCEPATDKNFPGGMDPTGPAVFKRCYMAQYAHGYNPEGSSDPDEDITMDQDPPEDD
jgi:hypothetical protein